MADTTPIEVSESDILLAQRILSASSRHDLDALRILLKSGSANVRDPATGTAPLHAVVEGCVEKKEKGEKRDAEGAVKEDGGAGGEGEKERVDQSKEEAAVAAVRLLFENGAIWNDLNKKGETPGCMALRLGLTKVYDEMVAAGVRAEMLFGRMKALGLDDDEEEEQDDEAAATEEATAQPDQAPQATLQVPTADEDDDVSGNNLTYLQSPLRFQPTILLDSSDNAVMMDWEAHIMQVHAETLLPHKNSPLRIVNVGHGMGIVDRAIQARSPAEHHIIEAHPQVQERLRSQGWHDKAGVTVHEGRWQDVLPRLVEQGVMFDAIYYDTFAEDYYALKEFFSEWVVQLLSEKGRFGWYNGLGADRQICYDVYTKVAEMDLFEAGFDTEWQDVSVPSDLHGSSQWEGTRRPYWTIDVYRLPINRWLDNVEETKAEEAQPDR